MTHASVFSGIGGPEVAATMLGWENLFHCEINPFGRRVLDYWFPNSKSYEDITTTDFTEWRGRVDVLTGGFPCQPFSYAGKRGGAEDDRYLWPSMYRAIDEIQPTWVVAENVAGILTMVEQGEVSKVEGTATLFDAPDDFRGRYELRETFTLQRICSDLESHGYSVQPVLIPACAVGAPHRRDRVFIVARRNDAPNPRCGGQSAPEQQGKRERPEVQQQSGEQSQHGTGRQSASRPIADTYECGGASQGQSAESNRPRADDIQGQARRGERPASERTNGLSSVLRHATDTACEPSERLRPRQSEVGRAQQEQPGGRDSEDGCGRTSADTINEGLQGRNDCDTQGHGKSSDGRTRQPCKIHGRERDIADTSDIGAGQREQTEREECGRPSLSEFRKCYGASLSADGGVCGERWQNFPAVSPVHRGNDGFPFDVDSLTLSFGKWRTEALKAYGNAIVPQVMYEIFRAIEQVDSEKPKNTQHEDK